MKLVSPYFGKVNLRLRSSRSACLAEYEMVSFILSFVYSKALKRVALWGLLNVV